MTLYRPLTSVAREYVEWCRSDHPRVPTGFSIMDSRTSGGAAYGEVILFQARSGVGKTTFANNVIVRNPDVPTVFFSLEMHARYILNRLAAINANVPTDFIEYELKTTGRCDAVQELVDKFQNLAIIDKPEMSFKDMHRALDEVEQAWQKKVGFVIWDYMELIGGIPSLNGGAESVDKIARKAKNFSRERDVVGLMLTQVGRAAGETGAAPLDMNSARFGGETQADYVLAAYRPCLRKDITQEEYLEERWSYYLQFLKTRGGSETHPQGVLHCFNPFTMRISEEWERQPLPLFAPGPETVDPDLALPEETYA